MKLTTISNDTWYKVDPVKPPNVTAPALHTMTMESEYKGDISGVSVNVMVGFSVEECKGEGTTNTGDVYYEGITTFSGTVNGKKGTFAARIKATCANNHSASTTTIIPGTGTGELVGITGQCSFRVPMTAEAVKDLKLDWDVEFQ